jgi:hypothetical protein
VFLGEESRLRAVIDLQLLEDARDMVSHRLLADEQLFRDRAVAHPGAQELQDLHLAARQLGEEGAVLLRDLGKPGKLLHSHCQKGQSDPMSGHQRIEELIRQAGRWAILWTAVWGIIYAWRRWVTYPLDMDDPLCQIALWMAFAGAVVLGLQSEGKAQRRVTVWMAVWAIIFVWRNWVTGPNSVDDPLWWLAAVMFVAGGIVWKGLSDSR